MSFLPKGTKIPTTSNYLKLGEGETTFRVLSPAITGFEYWSADKRPIRLKKEPQGVPSDIGRTEGKTNPIRYFWAFCVYNYNEERVQIAEFTQKTILMAIEALCNNGKWGDPMSYDITINRKGSNMDTEYHVVPNPKEKIADKIIEAYKAKNINLEALYEGADPFTTEGKINTMSPAFTAENYPENRIESGDIPF